MTTPRRARHGPIFWAVVILAIFAAAWWLGVAGSVLLVNAGWLP